MARLVRELRDEDAVAVTSPAAAIKSGVEGYDSAAELDSGLLVLKLRYNHDLPKAFRGE